MMTFLRDLGLTLIYGAPLALACCFAAYYLTKRLRVGGIWPPLIGLSFCVAAWLIFDWQTRSFTGGRVVSGGMGLFSSLILLAAEAASTRPILFKPKEKLRPADTTPEKRAHEGRAHGERAHDEQDQQRQELRR